MKLKTIINIITQVQPQNTDLKDKIFEWTSWFFLVAVMIILIFLFLVTIKTFIIDESDWAVNRANKKAEKRRTPEKTELKDLTEAIEQLKEINHELMKNSRPVALNDSTDYLLQRTKEAETKIKIEKLAKLLNRAVNLELLFEVAVAVGDTELVKLIKDVEEIIK